MSSDDTIQHVLQQEISALQRVAESIGNLDPLVSAIHDCQGKVVVTGMGKSGLIGRKISATLSSTATPSSFVHPAEALHGDIGTIGNDDFVLILSNSGETEELLALIPFLKRRSVKIAAMCCHPQSSLASKSDHVIPICVEQEADPFSLIPTCSTTAMLAVGDAIAVAVLTKRGLTRDQFAELHPSGSIGRKLLLQVGDVMHRGDAIPRTVPGTPIREVVSLMGSKRLGAAFIVDADDESRLLGVFTDGDLRRQLEKDANPLNHVIDEVMTKTPQTIQSHQLAVEAVAIMQSKQITILPVIDAEIDQSKSDESQSDQSGTLVGAVHLHDLIQAGLG